MSALFDAMTRTRSFPQMVADAIKTANREGRQADATVYRAIGDQVANTPR
jgi:hypothetical protein